MDAERARNETQLEVSRAQRYEIGTAIRYRVKGERGWHEGVTENISISGVLMHGARRLDPKTAVEMRFFLPVELEGARAAEVFCRGLVMRWSTCRKPAGTYTIAARIMHSRFLRQMSSKENAAKGSLDGHRRLSL